MRKNWRIVYQLIFGLLFILFIGAKNVEASEFNFSVVPTIPENQIDKSKTYFELKMEKGAEQELTLQLRNDTDKEVIVEADISPTTTNINGVVEYSANQIKKDSTLKYNLKDLTEVTKEIVLAPKSEQTLKVKVKMPNEEFKGLIAGGITLKEKEESGSDKEEKDAKGLSISNKYSYVLAIVLQQNEESITPELLLNQVKANQVNFRNVINANLQNPTSTYLNQLAINAEIKAKGTSEVLYSLKKNMMQMAPNSNFDLPISLEGKKLKAGKYTVEMDAYGVKSEKGEFTNGEDENGKPIKYKYHWTFTKDFEIKAEEAKKLNEADVTIPEEKNWFWLIIGLLVLLIIILIIIMVIVYKSQKNKQKNDRRQGSHKNSTNRQRKGPRPNPQRRDSERVQPNSKGKSSGNRPEDRRPTSRPRPRK